MQIQKPNVSFGMAYKVDAKSFRNFSPIDVWNGETSNGIDPASHPARDQARGETGTGGA